MRFVAYVSSVDPLNGGGVTAVLHRECPHPRCSRNVQIKFSGELSLRNPCNASVPATSSRELCGKIDNIKFQPSCAAA